MTHQEHKPSTAGSPRRAEPARGEFHGHNYRYTLGLLSASNQLYEIVTC